MDALRQQHGTAVRRLIEMHERFRVLHRYGCRLDVTEFADTYPDTTLDTHTTLLNTTEWRLGGICHVGVDCDGSRLDSL